MIRMHTGEIRFVHERCQHFREAPGKIIRSFGMVQDITERKQAEEALKDSEGRYRLLAETMLQGVIHQDANGEIIAMNPAAECILGKSREQFMGNSSDQEEHHSIHENGEPFSDMEHPSIMALRTGLPVRNIIMGVFNPILGDYRWISIDAVPIFHLGETCPSAVYTVFEDITERKQVEKVQTFLAQTSSSPADEPFFNALARYLAESLSMDFVCIDRLEEEGLTARTVAVWCDGHFEDNVTYTLKDTPCGEVVGQDGLLLPSQRMPILPARPSTPGSEGGELCRGDALRAYRPAYRLDCGHRTPPTCKPNLGRSYSETGCQPGCRRNGNVWMPREHCRIAKSATGPCSPT